MARRLRIGVDVGGTHTDLVVMDASTGSLHVEKVPSTPHDPSAAIMEAMERLLAGGVRGDQVEFFCHGTTVTTNALLERKGARMGLLITRGFRAIQEVQSGWRDGSPFHLAFQKPPPLVLQRNTWEVTERIGPRGEELVPLDEEEVAAAAAAIRERGIEAVAVCFLFSFMNPAHEVRAREIIQQVYPECFVSLSCQVLPRIREWPRLSTTLLNAYLEPVLARYLSRLQLRLHAVGVHTPQVFVMQSNGGIMPFRAAEGTGRAVQTLLSGPAAGVTAAAYIGSRQGFPNAISLDMGGTSCDVAFLRNGEPLEVTETTVDRRDCWLPAVDVSTIGAGGGSIAWVDASGLLHVGPRSAGAVPGPACYGRGGLDPTVTDADLLLGYLDPESFLGHQKLDVQAAARAMEERIARPLGLALDEAAAGVVRMVNVRMADLIKVHAAKRGLVPSDFVLLAFGGAGPLHAAFVATELGLPQVVVPRYPGVFSALGLLSSDIRHDYVRSDLRPLDQLTPDDIHGHLQRLRAQALADLEAQALDPDGAVFQYELDLRYAGQGYELRLPLPPEVGSRPDPGWVAQRFHQTHAEVHGHCAPEKRVEVVSYRLRAVVIPPKYLPVPSDRTRGHHGVPSSRRRARFPKGTFDIDVLHRDRLVPGDRGDGPAVVEQLDSTTLVPPGWTWCVDAFENLVLARQPAGLARDRAAYPDYGPHLSPGYSPKQRRSSP